MTSVSKDIFRSIHEGKWLLIEYQNRDSERKKYWIAIHNINLANQSLEVTGLHIGEFTTKELTVYIDKILSSLIMEGTYYKINDYFFQMIVYISLKNNDNRTDYKRYVEYNGLIDQTVRKEYQKILYGTQRRSYGHH